MPTLLTEPVLFSPPVVDDATRRRFLTGVVGAGLLTACGTGTVAPATAPATREVVDGTGRTVVIPADPQRILVISALYDVSLLVDLGVIPFGVADSANPRDRMPPALRAVFDGGAQRIGNTSSEVDAEQIAALAPDLILHNLNYGGIEPGVVQRIAPTITFDFLTEGLEPSLRRLGGWLDRDAQADAVVTRWNDRLAQLSTELNLGGRTFSTPFPITSDSTFLLYGPDSDLGRVVTALGGTIVPTQVNGQPLAVDAGPLSYELLTGLAEADTVLLVRRYGPFGGDEVPAFLADPLWRAIDAVGRGAVIELDIQDATGSHGYAGLETVAKAIADGLST